MKVKILPLLLLLISIFGYFKSSAQAINVQDSLALVDLYNSTNGDNWKNNSNWKTINPVSGWYGVAVTGNRVTSIGMYGNNLTGSIPSSIGNLSSLTSLTFVDNKIGGNLPPSIGNLSSLVDLHISANYLTGNIPSELGNLVNLKFLNLSNNNFTGDIPLSLSSLVNLQIIDLQSNNFTFTSIESLAQIFKTNNFNGFYYSPQYAIPIAKKGKKITVSPGGTLANNTVRWYKTGTGLVATNVGDTTFSPVVIGTYHAEVTNAIATDLILLSENITIDSIITDSTTTITKIITGTAPVDIDSGIIKLATLSPIAGANALSGKVTTILTIAAEVEEFNNEPYVQRHFDIIPEDNAATSKAIVTLYFIQDDFDNYNAYIIANNLTIPLLPVNGVDNGNVRITQYHGTFTGSSNPANYNSNNAVIITPNVTWNVNNKWWEVTFEVTGFSGFYVSSGNVVLPLTLLNFTAKPETELVKLQWTVSAEINTKEFIVQRKDQIAFHDIGSVAALSSEGINQYQFTDLSPVPGDNFYRLKMIDQDGNFSYSKIVKINFNTITTSLKIYPNPVASSSVAVNFNSEKKEILILAIADLSGKTVYQKTIAAKIGYNQGSLNVEKLPAGFYYLITTLNGKREKVPFVKNK